MEMGHAHAHAHAEEHSQGNYFLDQLFTILVCGALGIVAVLMYKTGMLSRILVPMFFLPVVLGGIALLVLAAIRAVAVWRLAGARSAAANADNDHTHEGGHSHGHSHSHGHDHSHAHDDCGHDHSHGEDCAHDHAHAHDHSHGDDHGHDHGWAPWRYMVLAIPVFLYFLDLPRSGFSDDKRDKSLSAGELQQGSVRKSLALLAGGMAYRKPEPRRLQLRFKELTSIAAVPSRHEQFEGDIGVLRGQFVPLRNDHQFTLFRVNMTCCAADAVFLETRIEAPDTVQGFSANDWVQVEGVISFQKNEKGKWIPVLTLKSNEDIRPTEPTADSEAF
jgi:uncharacterized repeat protein (TIGR03943 family)